MAQITYADKETLIDRTGVAAINKGRAQDWNEIKSVVNENEGSGSVTPQTYEAVVSFDGNDSTGVVGGLPFLTPTAAAVALRAASGTLMTIKAGTYVAEDLLFADGIISCHDGVTLKTGNNNAMFENIDGSYDGIDFQILGNPTLEKMGSENQFNITSFLGSLEITASMAFNFSNIIKTTNLTIDSIRFNLENCECTEGSINIIEADLIIVKGIGASKININISNITTGIIQLSDDGNSSSEIVFNANKAVIFQPIDIDGEGLFDINFKYLSGSQVMNISSGGGGGIYNINGWYALVDTIGEFIFIADNSVGKFNIKGYYDKGSGEIITCGTAQTVNVIGSLTMVTTASPKVNANITINDIQDY